MWRDCEKRRRTCGQDLWKTGENVFDANFFIASDLVINTPHTV